MACYRPIPAAQDGQSVKLWPPMGSANLAIPCGKCVGCRSARATQWAHRCSHEASQFRHNTFITLTYDDDHLPTENHLDARALQRFIKRLRKRREKRRGGIAGDRHRSLRYFACGEYGEEGGRPHYHLIAFNCGFPDQRRVGRDLYESDILRELWPHGSNRCGEATPAAANYIAQYSMKKQGAGDHDADGVWRPAPFLRMSLKPAIGLDWLRKYGEDLAHGYLVAGGRKQAIPRAYKEKLKEINPHLAEEINIRTQENRKRNPTDSNDLERLQAAEIIHERYKQLTNRKTL